MDRADLNMHVNKALVLRILILSTEPIEIRRFDIWDLKFGFRFGFGFGFEKRIWI